MGWTSENVAKEFNVTRGEQDTFAAESFQKAELAQKNLRFVEEIVPFTVFRKEPASEKRTPVVVREDDGIRFGTTVESLSKLKPAFPQWGNSTTTGGNASQITDGAAAVLLMTRNEAKRRGLPILGKFITTAVAGETSCSAFQPYSDLALGVPPRIMGIGPVYAIPLALKNAGLELKDVDLFEVCNFMLT
jgi:acetyl-CoA acetyltransferase